MKFNSLLKKAQSRIVNPTSMDRAKTAHAMDIERFAIVTLHNKHAADALSVAGMAGLGGLVAGGGTYASLNKREDESEKDFKKRKIREALINAGAGAIAGGAIPVAGGMLSPLLSEERTPIADMALRNLTLPLIGATSVAITDQYRHGKKLPELEARDISSRKALSEALKAQRSTTVTTEDAKGGKKTTINQPDPVEEAAAIKAQAAAEKSISSVEKDLERSRMVTSSISDSLDKVNFKSPVSGVLKSIKASIKDAIQLKNPLKALSGIKMRAPITGGMSLLENIGRSATKGKLRNPLLAATASMSLPFLLKKIDQSYSS